MLTVLCLACVVAAGCTRSPSAPATADTVAVERAAAGYAAGHLLVSVSRDRLAFDSLPGDGHGRSHAQSMALAKILHAEATDRASVIACANGPSSCRMGAFTGLIGIHLQSLDDSTAAASVAVSAHSARQAITSR